MLIPVINRSTLLVGKEKEILQMAQACSLQLKRDCAPLWSRTGGTVAYFADEKHCPPDSNIIYLFDAADQAGALGYHDETPEGAEYGRVFVQTIMEAGGKTLEGSLSVSAVLSHEVLELWGDPNCNLWADGTNGKSVAFELSDPVENDIYEINVRGGPVSVSNFILPDWFDPFAPEPHRFDFLNKLTAPFSMTAGGYLIERAEGRTTQVFGAGSMHPARALSKMAKSSRARKRGLFTSPAAK